MKHPTRVTKPAQVAALLNHVAQHKQEHVVCLYLNARNQVLTRRTISIGTVNSALIHPREVFAPALEVRATAFIMAHNHPSQDPQPSEEDILITQKIVEASEIMNIPLLDHIIITKHAWSSLKQLQLL